MLTHKVKVKSKKAKGKSSKRRLGFYFLLFTFAFATSCGSKRTDLRTLVPADSLVYLEANDLGEVMKAITDRPAFREAAKTIPDFSILNGVKLAVAVTGFETKEQPVTDEASVLNFQPRFVAVLETNAWNYQAIAFTEQKLGEFINNVYGGEVLLETSGKHEGKYFVWKANDGRKAYALVQGSLVFFGNDETAIEKSLAVKRGEADSITKNPKITDGDRLAFGYVSPDGVAQIANLLGVKYASEASDEPEVQSAVAGILPQLLRDSVTEIVWTAAKSVNGMEDTYSIGLANELSMVLNETITPSNSVDRITARKIPEDTLSITRYNLQRPQIAWRSLVLATQKQADPLNSKIVQLFSQLALEPYGIEDPELFLSAVGPQIITVDFDGGSAKQVVIAKVADYKKIRESLSKSIAFQNEVNVAPNGAYQVSTDGDFAITTSGNEVILGEAEAVKRCLESSDNRENLHKHPMVDRFFEKKDEISVTFGNDTGTTQTLVDVLAIDGNSNARTVNYLTESHFDRTGVKRRTISDFGFIGWIITQFGKDQ